MMNRLLPLLALPFAFSACAPVPTSPPGPAYQGARSAAEEAAHLEVPTLTVLKNGNILVRFEKKGCEVLFDANGQLLSGGRLCDDVDLHRARVAVKAHIAEREADFLDV